METEKKGTRSKRDLLSKFHAAAQSKKRGDRCAFASLRELHSSNKELLEFTDDISTMLNTIPNDAVSDTTKADSSNLLAT